MTVQSLYYEPLVTYHMVTYHMMTCIKSQVGSTMPNAAMLAW